MDKPLYFAYPAILTRREEQGDILVEFVDLPIEAFSVAQSRRSELFDIVWSRAARCVQEMILLGQDPPPQTKLEDLPLTGREEQDAVLIELIG